MSSDIADRPLLERLAAVSTTSLCDADATARVPIGLVGINVPGRVAGPARTVSSRGDLVPVLRGLESVARGEVLVVDTAGATGAVAGELFALHAVNAGAVALVIDGYVRDADTLRTLPLAVYARGVVPRAGGAQAWGELQTPVSCGGVHVDPGDLVVADSDGIVVTSAAQAAATIDRAEQIEANEARIRQGLRDGTSLFAMLNFDEVSAALQQDTTHPLRLRPPEE